MTGGETAHIGFRTSEPTYGKLGATRCSEAAALEPSTDAWGHSHHHVSERKGWEEAKGQRIPTESVPRKGERTNKELRERQWTP